MPATPDHASGGGWLGQPDATKAPASVLIPVYQEVGSLPGVVMALESLAREGLLAEGGEIIVIDDGSEDETVPADFPAASGGALARRLIRHPRNMGYGAAVKTGLRAARNEIIVLIDGDGTYPVDAIPGLLRALNHSDMAVGARIGPNVAIPAERRPAKWVLQKFAEFLAQQPIPDLNSGLRAFRRSEAMRHMGLYPRGFSFTTTITLAYLCTDKIVVHESIDYLSRATGKSKIRPFRDTQRIAMTIVRSVLAFNPLRVFMPLAMALVVAALLVLAFIRDHAGNVTDVTVGVLLIGAMICVLTGLLADVVSRSRK